MAANAGLRLIQFAREPLPGRVKTRMMPHLSPERAADLHCELVRWTTSALISAGLGPVELAVAGNTGHDLFQHCLWLGVEGLSLQRGSDLGERMYNAISNGLGRCDRVILVGSDCPGIDRAYLLQAEAALNDSDLVLGPATDGGYVLIGANLVCPEIFQGIAWGTETVLADTRRSIRAAGMSWAELPPLADIDRPEDLAIWEEVVKGG